jgi:type I restriction enzyme S subunit
MTSVATEGVSNLPAGWRMATLGEVAVFNPRRAGSTIPDEQPTSFVPMAAVDERRGAIADRIVRPFADVRKGYTYFEEGDVLFAKITPCMQNGKHAIARHLENGFGFGTTEFHVIRPREAVTSEWIHYFVRQPSVLRDAEAHFTGAVGQQRVPDAYLASVPFPVPPLDEQRRITAMLDEQMAAIERARMAAEQQLALLDRLAAASLKAAFGGVGA